MEQVSMTYEKKKILTFFLEAWISTYSICNIKY